MGLDHSRCWVLAEPLLGSCMGFEFPTAWPSFGSVECASSGVLLGTAEVGRDCPMWPSTPALGPSWLQSQDGHLVQGKQFGGSCVKPAWMPGSLPALPLSAQSSALGSGSQTANTTLRGAQLARRGLQHRGHRAPRDRGQWPDTEKAGRVGLLGRRKLGRRQLEGGAGVLGKRGAVGSMGTKLPGLWLVCGLNHVLRCLLAPDCSPVAGDRLGEAQGQQLPQLGCQGLPAPGNRVRATE